MPNARVGIGHGANGWQETRRIDVGLMNGEFDVLVATTIIESGLMPNANTIFINNANEILDRRTAPNARACGDEAKKRFVISFVRRILQ